MARNLKFGNREAMTFCATYNCVRNMSVVPAIARSERARGVLGGGGDKPSPKSVWADAHDLDLKASLAGNPRS
ncbi:hypothetical protein C5Y41_15045 [Rahnella variigena]|nr:hypothetical protein C5Y41_15045 [Rahnella variigena]